jgi:outer membrane protein TolC
MRKLIFIGTLLCTIAKSFAQQVPRDSVLNMSLRDCINYAYQHQDSVVNAGLDVKSAEYKVKETIGSGLPQINGSGTFQDYLRTPTSVGPQFLANPPDPKNPFSAANIATNLPVQKFPFGAVAYNNTYSIQATQLLFSGTYIVGLQAVKTFKELSHRNFIRSKIETNINVTKAYYQVLVSNEQLKLLDANITQLKQQLDQTTSQNQQGFVEKIDVDRLAVQYSNLVTNRENTSRLLVLNYQMLKFQMGMSVYQQIKLTDKLEDIDLNQQAGNTVDTAFYHNRIEYNLLETNIKLNQLNVKSKKAEYLPSLSANGGYAEVFEENHFRYLYNHAYPYSYVGLSLNIPIFSGGQRNNQLKELEITVQKSKNDLENAKNGFSLQASAANITYINGLQSLNNQKKSRELAKEVLHVATVKYQQGVGSSLEVTQAETDFETADNQYIQALYNVLISKVDLDQAYGRIK